MPARGRRGRNVTAAEDAPKSNDEQETKRAAAELEERGQALLDAAAAGRLSDIKSMCGVATKPLLSQLLNYRNFEGFTPLMKVFCHALEFANFLRHPLDIAASVRVNAGMHVRPPSHRARTGR